MSIPAEVLVHEVTVEPYLGSGAYGDRYGDPFPLPAYIEEGATIVRDSTGADAVSTATIYVDPAAVDGADAVPVDSRVSWSLGGRRDARAIAVDTFDDGGLTGLAHRVLKVG